MASRSDIPVGATRMTLPGSAGQDGSSADPTAVYPVAQSAQSTAPAIVTLAKGVRTKAPMPAGDTSYSICEFASSRIDAVNNVIKPMSSSERMIAALTVKIDKDPSSGALATGIGGALTALSGVGFANYVLNNPQAVYLELDIGVIILAQTNVLSVLPTVIGVTFPLLGGAPFLANGCSVYLTSSVSGLIATDTRVLLQQVRP